MIETPAPGEDEEIVVRCHHMPPALLNLLTEFKTTGHMLVAYVNAQIHRVPPKDVYYIETVDNKTFLYCQDMVLESKQKLYELEAMGMRDFLRISKSCIINLSKIKTLVPALGGRFDAVLTNGERVIISRQYMAGLKKELGI